MCQADSACVCYICLFYSSAAALVSVLWPAWSSCAALALVIVTALLRNNFQIILMGKFACLASVLTNFHLHTYFSGIYNNFLLMSGCELTLASLLFFHGLFFCELHFRCHQLFLKTALCSSKKTTLFCVKGHGVHLSEYCSLLHIVRIWLSVFVLESLSNILVTPCLISCDGNSMQHENETAAQGQVWGMFGSARWRTHDNIINLFAPRVLSAAALSLSLPAKVPACFSLKVEVRRMRRHVASRSRGNQFCWRIGQSRAPQDPSRRRCVSCEGWKTMSDRLPLGGSGDMREGKPTVTTQFTWFVPPQYIEQTTPQGFLHSRQHSFLRKRKSDLTLWLWERLTPKEELRSLFFSI